MNAVSASSSHVSASRKLTGRISSAQSLPVLRKQTKTVRQSAVASSERREAAISAAIVASVGAAMANPLIAEAAVTPTLKNLVNSVVAGSVVLGAIALAVTAVANFDPVRPGR